MHTFTLHFNSKIFSVFKLILAAVWCRRRTIKTIRAFIESEYKKFVSRSAMHPFTLSYLNLNTKMKSSTINGK